MSYLKYFEVVEDLIKDLKNTQEENIKKAGAIIAQSIMAGGIIQTFGSGHSYASAIEISGRAGGLIPAKCIVEPSMGKYETIEGIGRKLMETVDVEDDDCIIIISNSGRNPLIIEIAEFIKERGNKVIAVTSLEVSKTMKSRHSSGKMLYDFADVILDNQSIKGDAAISLQGMPTKVCATSSVAAAILLNASVLESIEIMLEKNYKPPVYMSDNVDGGREYNKKLLSKYSNRLYRL